MESSPVRAAASLRNARQGDPIKGGSAPDRLPPRVARRLWPQSLDGRCRAARRVKQLQAEFMAVLGGEVNAATETRVRALAQMIVEAEALRLQALSGQQTDVAARVKMENVIARLRRELGVDRPRKPEPVTLAEYLARKRAEA